MKQGRWLACLRAALLVTLVTLAQTVCAQETTPAPCLIVYGHARNSGDAAENEAWDRVNQTFNAQVTQRLRAGGQRALPLLFKAGVTDVADAVATLVDAAERQGCQRVVDTAVFADGDGKTLIVRLRVHPVLGRAGPRALAAAAPRIGEAVYSSQRDLELNQRTLERVNLAALAEQMVAAYLSEP